MPWQECLLCGWQHTDWDAFKKHMQAAHPELSKEPIQIPLGSVQCPHCKFWVTPAKTCCNCEGNLA